MQTDYQFRVANSFIAEIANIEEAEKYLENSVKRNSLALLYKSIINIGQGFPKRQLSMNTNVSSKLYKRVSDTCSQCVKRSEMKKCIDSAINDLKYYSKELKNFIGNSEELIGPKTIHDLRPTDDNKDR